MNDLEPGVLLEEDGRLGHGEADGFGHRDFGLGAGFEQQGKTARDVRPVYLVLPPCLA